MTVAPAESQSVDGKNSLLSARFNASRYSGSLMRRTKASAGESQERLDGGRTALSGIDRQLTV